MSSAAIHGLPDLSLPGMKSRRELRQRLMKQSGWQQVATHKDMLIGRDVEVVVVGAWSWERGRN